MLAVWLYHPDKFSALWTLIEPREKEHIDIYEWKNKTGDIGQMNPGHYKLANRTLKSVDDAIRRSVIRSRCLQSTDFLVS